MRFDSRWRDTARIWVVCCVLQLVSSVLRLRHDMVTHRSPSWAITMFVVWLGLLLFYVYAAFRSTFRLTADSVDLVDGYTRKKVDYSSIVAVRIPRREKDGKAVPDAVELEIAPLSPNIFPHTYTTVRLRNAQAFAEALHERAPQAVYEPA